MLWLYILLFFLILVAVCFLLGQSLASHAMGIHRQTLEEARAWQEAHYDISWYDQLQKTSYVVSSYDGYLLHAEYIHNPSSLHRCVILSHGYTDNHFGSLKYTKMYLDLGFDVLLYDLRGHGSNEETFCTYSIQEAKDLAEVIQDTRKRFTDLTFLGLHGESLGAATSVAVLKYAPDIDFVVEDCGFSEITSILRAGLVKMHLPGALVHLASLCARLRYGVWFHDMRPIDSLRGNRIPILFLHGAEDDFIPPSHAESMQSVTEGFCERYLIPCAGHAASILTAPEAYQSHVQSFLEQISNPVHQAT